MESAKKEIPRKKKAMYFSITEIHPAAAEMNVFLEAKSKSSLINEW